MRFICSAKIGQHCNSISASPFVVKRNQIVQYPPASHQVCPRRILSAYRPIARRLGVTVGKKLWPSKYLGADRAEAGTGLVHWQLDRFQPMIAFPNYSRSYDRTRHAVRFWGYDSAMEASFFIDEGALRRIQPDTRPDESGFLNAFDSNRDVICAAAARVYVRGSRGSYDLVANNF